MDFDILTQSYTDLDGGVHIVAPLQYLHMIEGMHSAAEATHEMLQELAGIPQERLEIKEKYQQVARANKEPSSALVPAGSGRRKKASDGIPQFHFNPARSRRLLKK